MKLITNSQRILEELFNQDFADSEAYSDESQYFEFFFSKEYFEKFRIER